MPVTLKNLIESEIAVDLYIESAQEWSYVIPSSADGSRPEDWFGAVGADPDVLVMDSPNFELLNRTLGFNDFERFLELHNAALLEADRFSEGMRYELAQGLTLADFEVREGEPIPILLSEKAMETRGLRYGDTAHLARAEVQANSGVLRGFDYYNVRGAGDPWRFVEVVVIGSFDGSVRDANGMPVDVLMHHDGMVQWFGDRIGYTRFLFNINPERNRDIYNVRDELHLIKTGGVIGTVAWGGRRDALGERWHRRGEAQALSVEPIRR